MTEVWNLIHHKQGILLVYNLQLNFDREMRRNQNKRKGSSPLEKEEEEEKEQKEEKERD